MNLKNNNNLKIESELILTVNCETIDEASALKRFYNAIIKKHMKLMKKVNVTAIKIIVNFNYSPILDVDYSLDVEIIDEHKDMNLFPSITPEIQIFPPENDPQVTKWTLEATVRRLSTAPRNRAPLKSMMARFHTNLKTAKKIDKK